MNWITQHWSDVLQVISYIIASASIITALTPTPKDDALMAKLHSVLKLLGLNVGNAKPK